MLLFVPRDDVNTGEAERTCKPSCQIEVPSSDVWTAIPHHRSYASAAVANGEARTAPHPFVRDSIRTARQGSSAGHGVSVEPRPVPGSHGRVGRSPTERCSRDKAERRSDCGGKQSHAPPSVYNKTAERPSSSRQLPHVSIDTVHPSCYRRPAGTDGTRCPIGPTSCAWGSGSRAMVADMSGLCRSPL